MAGGEAAAAAAPSPPPQIHAASISISPRLLLPAAHAGAAEGRDATGLSSLRIGKPSAADMDALMSDWSSRSCNHEFAGASKAAPNLPAAVQQGGFMISKKREKVRWSCACCSCAGP